jgi:N-acetylglucosaminyldiphosphoundecaprenol N-acetyl-beta-D-mannosaminyltransferase
MMTPVPSERRRDTENVVGMPVDVIDWNGAVDRILGWASNRESRMVCICAVHSIVTALQNDGHAKSLQTADMVTPDGAPIAWMLRAKGHRNQARISGPDLMMKCCERAAETGEGMFLYGGTPETLEILEQQLKARFPGLRIAGSFSPPFRAMTAEEDEAVIDMISKSGAGIVWVGLGCPKQEAWMYAHLGRVKAVMVGVGAAFDFNAGVVKRAPVWMQRSGLEWLYRMSQDPRRLARRYAATNAIFVFAALKDLLSTRASLRAAGRRCSSAE